MCTSPVIAATAKIEAFGWKLKSEIKSSHIISGGWFLIYSFLWRKDLIRSSSSSVSTSSSSSSSSSDKGSVRSGSSRLTIPDADEVDAWGSWLGSVFSSPVHS